MKDNQIPGGLCDSTTQGCALALVHVLTEQPNERRVILGEPLENLTSPVRGRIVDDDDFERCDAGNFHVHQTGQRLRNEVALVKDGNDYAKSGVGRDLRAIHRLYGWNLESHTAGSIQTDAVQPSDHLTLSPTRERGSQ